MADALREDILCGKYAPGQKLPSENELSSEHGISRQTVRQATGVLELEGLVVRIRGSGTYISADKHKKAQPTKNIGIISTYNDSYIFPAIISSIEAVLAENGFTMQLSMTHNQVENEARALKTLIEKGVDGLIVEPTKSGLPNPNLALYEQIKARNIPLIFFNAFYPNLDFHHICMDDRLAGKLAAKCLIDAGHTAIAGMFQSDDRQGHLRYAGFMEALKEAGLTQKSANIVWFVTEDIPYIAEDIARVTRSLNGCTGLVCYNDQIAYTVIRALNSLGYLVPDELSVVGVDNAEISIHCTPPLTTLSHPLGELGHKAAKNILSLIRNLDFPATYEFVPEIIWRETVRPPRKCV